MNTKKIPIDDLLSFIGEQREQEKINFKNIVSCIQEHFSMLKDKEIFLVSEKMVLDNLCFLEHGFIKNGKMPLVEGLLLKRNKSEYGILFKGIQNRWIPEEKNYLTYKVWLIKQNEIIEEKFEPTNWEEWGALTSYYDYSDYEACCDKNLGCRALSFGDVGKDVFLLQKLAQKFEPSLKTTGEFDFETVQCLNKMRYSFQLDDSEPEISEDQILIIADLLTNEN